MIDKEHLLRLTESYLRSLISAVYPSAASDFASSTPFGELGIDSFHVLKIIKELESDFGRLPKTLLFENFNLDDLTNYFVNKHEHTVTIKFSGKKAFFLEKSDGSSIKEEKSIPASKNLFSTPAVPILILEKVAFAHPELTDLVTSIFSRYKNEGSVSRGTRSIAPNLFIGSARRGYFNYSRSKNIILLYAYTGPKDYFNAIAQEAYEYCADKGFQLNIISDEVLDGVGDIGFSSTPFGALQKITNIKNFTLDGKKMRRLRYQVSKFEQAGICRTEEYRCGTQVETDKDIANIIDQWCSARSMVNPLIYRVKEEILAGCLHPDHRIFLTYTEKNLQNVILISALSEEENGYLMDLEFYSRSMPLGGLEFAIVKIIETLVAEGRNLLSLGGTYGCKLHASPNADAELDRILDDLRQQNIFNDEGNLQFKNKFRPENKAIYLCRPKDSGDADNVIDIIMMIADPERMQTSDVENYTVSEIIKNVVNFVENSPTDVLSTKSTLSIEPSSEEHAGQTLSADIDYDLFAGNDRSHALCAAGFNPFNLSTEHIAFDLKSDSWAQLENVFIKKHMKSLHGRLQESVKVDDCLKQVFPFAHIILTASGRTAEQVFYKAWPKKGIVLQNLLFPTGIFHQIDNSFEPVEVPDSSVYMVNTDQLYKSNLDWQALQGKIEADPQAIAMVCIELANNAAGGCPVALSHLHKVKALLASHHIPLVLDATRVVENAQFLIKHEKTLSQKNVWDVVHEILSIGDIVIASLAKDFGVDKGGIVATNDAALFHRMQEIVQGEGCGLDVLNKKLIALALQDRKQIESRVLLRMEWVQLIGSTLKRHNVPVVQPLGGHCVLIDVKRLPMFSGFEHPVASFLAWMYLNASVRAGAHSVGMQTHSEINGLVRIAIPTGMKREDIESLITHLVQLFSHMANIPELFLEPGGGDTLGSTATRYQLKKYHNIKKNSFIAQSNGGECAAPSPSASAVLLPEHAATAVTNQSLSSHVPRNLADVDTASKKYRAMDIAIIGMAGRYPKAKNLDELWDNLVQGKDCIEDIPASRFENRWQYETLSRYRGGFINDVDKFDSLFFNISPREAEMLDPQERLFLEVAWETIEDAGYYPEILTKEDAPRNIGVFVGAVWSMYQILGAEERLAGNKVTPNSFLWSVANRVSYWMNFSGPSLTLDTACSSSLTAIYLACEAIAQGECSAALAGGVNLDLHQSKFDINLAGGALSKDGLCRTFGQGANGYVAGEGIGAILLKPLKNAIRDRDNIHGVIKSAVINHGGRNSGYSVPNPKAQSALVSSALEKAGINAKSIGYVEAHGTGTELGDPIEISGLTNAFQTDKVDNQTCAIGSIKSNIGHLEAAAGVVGVCKVLLQMRHRQIVPSLHSAQLNEFIDFEQSPFYVEQQLEDWRQKEIDNVSVPLRAGVSSFGAGGSNAHIVLEKYDYPSEESDGSVEKIFPFSARNEEQLREMVIRFKNYLEKNTTSSQELPQQDLLNISYTLRFGRKSFDYRLVVVAATRAELITRLTCFITGKSHEKVISGHVKNAETITKLLSRREKEDFISLLSQGRDTEKLAVLWIEGLFSDWQGFEARSRGRRISLPTYPFADKRYWIPREQKATDFFVQPWNSKIGSRLHPLIDSNESRFDRQLFKKTFHDREFFIYDHLVSDIPTLPGVAYLELARKAGEIALGRKVQKIKNILWVSPLTVKNSTPTEAFIDLKPSGELVHFEVFSEGDDGRKQLYSQGKLSYATKKDVEAEPEFVDIEGVLARCSKIIDGKDTYPLFKSLGLGLGPGFQVLQEVYKSETEILGVLKLPEVRHQDFQEFLLHPSLVDGSFQAGMAAQIGNELGEMFVPYSIGEVEVLHPLQPHCFSYVTRVKEDKKSNSKLSKANVYILDEQGKILVKMHESIGVPLIDVHEKPEQADDNFEQLYYVPVWEPLPLAKNEITPASMGPMILFACDENLFHACKTAVNNASVILVKCGEVFDHTADQTYLINPANPEDYLRLFESLSQQGIVLDKICFAWPFSQALDIDPAAYVAADEQLKTALITGVYAFFSLCQALIKHNLKHKIQLLYLYNTHQGHPQPHHDAVNGYFKTLQLENPKFSGKVLEVQHQTVVPQEIAALIFAEFQAVFQDSVTIRYQEQERYVRRLQQFDPGSDNNFSDDKNLSLKERGLYLITGGVGGLGLIFSEFLAKACNARLMLTGRSELSPDSQTKLDHLRKLGAEVHYFRADVARYEDISRVIHTIRSEFGDINGVIHSAGVLRDSFIRNKTLEDMSAVLAPKLYGTLYLDELTKDDALDFFAMFSSLAAIGGNAGQCDYAFANHYLDSFANKRNLLQQQGKRAGKTLSINWSLWAEGGMKVDAQTELLFKKNLGIKPLSNRMGTDAFLKGLAGDESQLLVLEGVRDKIERAWGMQKLESPAPASVSEYVSPGAVETAHDSKFGGDIENAEVVNLVQQALSQLVVDFLKIDPDDISLDAILLDLGFDSIGLTSYANALNDKYQLDITPVLFFEYPSIREITRYITTEHQDAVALVHKTATSGKLVATSGSSQAVDAEENTILLKQGWKFAVSVEESSAVENTGPREHLSQNRFANQPIAIVGMSGVMPQSDDLDEFWDNLKNARNLITTIPKDRWIWEEYDGDPLKERNKTNSKWGGFMREVDQFDPLFFGISPREAEMMDPQQRIFLQTVWKAVEDAGQRVADLSGTKTGLFVGVATRDYTDLMNWQQVDLDGYSASGNSHSVLVNRISFLLNLRGPSAPLDTACSSSLIALHRAVESIHTGSSDMAIVGGVQVMLTPAGYISFAMAGMLSGDGKCKTFDKSANGYVRGEGSGAIFIKPLSMAEADGNHIYAIIKSTAENHGGRVTTLTAPNPSAQAELLVEAYEKAGIDPSTVGYIECHGTGTSLGDPIEIQALNKSFAELYRKRNRAPADLPHCGLSSVKTNIGHLETAAGIAGILKVLLAIKHKQIPATIHFEELNPYINLKGSPFYIVDKTSSWPVIHADDGTAIPRRAGVSSFGFGGANAHIVLEEYLPAYTRTATPISPNILVLSAKNEERLKAYASSMLGHLEKNSIELADFAYTLQVGRDAMPERLALIVNNLDEVKHKLAQFLAGQADINHFYHNNIRNKNNKTAFNTEQSHLQALLELRDLHSLAATWVTGTDLDWRRLYTAGYPKRIPLPGYPFAKERCWFHSPIAKHKTQTDSSTETNTENTHASVAAVTTDRQLSPITTRTACYYPIWREQLVNEKNGTLSGGNYLIFDRDESLLTALKNCPQGVSMDTQFVLVKVGPSYRELDETVYEINPQRPAEYQQLLQSLMDHDRLPQHIIYHWAEEDFSLEQEKLRLSLEKGVYSLVYLIQALMNAVKEKAKDTGKAQDAMHTGIDAKLKTKFLYLYPSQAQTQPHHAAIAGLARSVALEHSTLSFKIIGLQDESFSDAQAITQRIAVELQEQIRSVEEIRYRVGKRWVKSIAVADMPVEGQLCLREDGVYLLTGGGGALGLIFAEYIAQRVTSHLLLVGRSPLGPAQNTRIQHLQSLGARVSYYQADIADEEDIKRLMTQIKASVPAVNGIIHCAGTLRDAAIANKTREDIDVVFAAKIRGTANLDKATKDEQLDFFALFSSVTAVTGNIGQSDYAYANSFMDNFARWRNDMRAAGQRIGKAISFNWPLWESGGMQVDAKLASFLEHSTGMKPLNTQAGLDVFKQALNSEYPQVIVVEGDQLKVQKILGMPNSSTGEFSVAGGTSGDMSPENNHGYEKAKRQQVHAFLLSDLAQLVIDILRIKPEAFSHDVDMNEFGLDSINQTQFFAALNEKYSLALTPAFFYEYPTLNALTEYLCGEYPAPLSAHYRMRLDTALAQFSVAAQPTQQVTPSTTGQAVASSGTNLTAQHQGIHGNRSLVGVPIAIVGISCVMPQSDDVNTFWDNLIAGRDLVTEIPAERWDWEAYQGNPLEEKNKTNSKWGGFINDIDKFDAAFFGISPAEAMLMDPQQRIFLETVWKVIEDAGHRPSDLAGTRTGIFVGAGTSDYADVLRNSDNDIVAYTATGISHSLLPNRISYLLDLRGPSEPIDTACSSSLVAVHRAVEAIQNGYCEMAIAGGVNALLSPSLYISLGSAGVLSSEGRCRTFDKRANGYVRGEGTGAVLLKSLDQAIADGNPVYGLIKGIGINHGGRATSLTAPNPNAQAELLIDIYEKFDIDHHSIAYIETHGTGTALGDSVEINGLKKAFRELSKRRPQHSNNSSRCGLGALKSNTGHLETSAGIAALIKVLLSIKNKKIPANIHFEELNPHIQLDNSPFYIINKAQDWEPLTDDLGGPLPRRAGISSFGFGGVNAHLVVEEYPAALVGDKSLMVEQDGSCIVPLSAKSKSRLRQKVVDLLAFICRQDELALPIDLASMAYTLQLGRDAMDIRLGFLVTSVEQLAKKLNEYLQIDGADIEDCYQGQIKDNQATLSLLHEDMPVLVEHWIASHNYAKLVDFWVKGLCLDWQKLYAGKLKPQRISLPGYPFAKERHWPLVKDCQRGAGINNPGTTLRIESRQPLLASAIHPLLHVNTSDLSQHSYSSLFSGNEWFLFRMSRFGNNILPAAAYLEMARAAIANALPIAQEPMVLELYNIALGQPAEVLQSVEFKTALLVHDEETIPKDHTDISFEIYSLAAQGGDDSREVVHCQGRALFTVKHPPAGISINEIINRLTIDGSAVDATYQTLAASGITYGPAVRAIKEIHQGEGELLALLCLPVVPQLSQEQYFLHPGMIECAMHASIVLVQDLLPVHYHPSLPFAMESVHILSACTNEMAAWIRFSQSEDTEEGVVKVDIDLLDRQGSICVQLRCVSYRYGTSLQDSNDRAWIFRRHEHAVKSSKHQDAAQKMEFFLQQEIALQCKKSVEEINLEQNFFELGISSLGITSVMEKVSEILDYTVSSSIIFEYRNINSLAAHLAETYSDKLGFVSISKTGNQEKNGNLHVFNWQQITRLPNRKVFLPRSKFLAPEKQATYTAEDISSAHDLLEKITWQENSDILSYEKNTF